MIPVKGYASYHPLKHCMVGSGFQIDWFKEFFSDKKILDPLQRIAEETEEDFLELSTILTKAGVEVHRPKLEIEKYNSLRDIYRPPMTPRDHFAVIGEKFYAVQYAQGYSNVLKKIKKEQMYIKPKDSTYTGTIDTASILRAGKDLYWGHDPKYGDPTEYVNMFEQEGFRVHLLERDYHSDAVISLIKPRVAIAVKGIADYEKTMPGWEVLLIDDNPSLPFVKSDFKSVVKGRWWIQHEENNAVLAKFIDQWLGEWVGYVAESVFDVNTLSIDENTVICNNYNKSVFDFLKKHQVEPVLFNFRHRYFWDGGIHCITQDLYREGTQEDYFG
jgi:N-dimethylarginine dimethylaminohydrolase